MRASLPVLWLCGPPGVGKSSVAWIVYEVLGQASTVAYLDIDQLSLRFAPDGEGDQHRAKVANFAVMINNFAAAGAELVVFSGVVDPDEVADFTAVTPVTWVRLRCEVDELQRRFLGRGMAAELVPRVIEHAELLDVDEFAGVVIDTTDLGPAQVAELVLRQAQDGGDQAQDGGDQAQDGGDQTQDGGDQAQDGGRARALRQNQDARGRAIWVGGPRAVGKSTIGWELLTQAHCASTLAAYVDLAQVGFLRPATDVEVRTVSVANLAGLWRTYRADGAELLVISGTADPETVAAVRALDLFDLTVVSLRAGADPRRSRIADRAAGRGAHLAGDDLIGLSGGALASATEALLATGEPAESADVVVDTDGEAATDLGGRLLTEHFSPTLPLR